MDSLTQGALGGLCGELTLRKELGWRGFAWGVFFGTLPDLDILVFPFLEPIERLAWHRGLSHSLLIMVVGSLVFGWWLAWLHRRSDVSFKRAFVFVLITWGSHVLIDCFTTYGTQVYEPFSDRRVAFDNISIIDISFTLPMLLALLVAVFFKRGSKRRRWLGYLAALWLVFYTSASFFMKAQAERYFQAQLAERSIVPVRVMTAPTLSNIFLWRMLVESDDEYHIGYWSFFDDPDRVFHLESVPNGHSKLEGLEAYEEVKELKWFAKDWYMVTDHPDDEDLLLFIDMRFSEMCLPSVKSPVFVWSLAEEKGELEFQQVSFRNGIDKKEAVAYLWERVRGRASGWMQAPWPWGL